MRRGDCGGTPTSCAFSKTPSSRTHASANGSVSRQTNAPRRHVDGATLMVPVVPRFYESNRGDLQKWRDVWGPRGPQNRMGWATDRSDRLLIEYCLSALLELLELLEPPAIAIAGGSSYFVISMSPWYVFLHHRRPHLYIFVSHSVWMFLTLFSPMC